MAIFKEERLTQTDGGQWRGRPRLRGGGRTEDSRGFQIICSIKTEAIIPRPRHIATPLAELFTHDFSETLVEEAVEDGVYDGCQHAREEREGVGKRGHHGALR